MPIPNEQAGHESRENHPCFGEYERQIFKLVNKALKAAIDKDEVTFEKAMKRLDMARFLKEDK